LFLLTKIVNGRLRYPMLTGDVLNVFASMILFENVENLGFGKSTFLMVNSSKFKTFV
jgi:hypothetical protein